MLGIVSNRPIVCALGWQRLPHSHSSHGTAAPLTQYSLQQRRQVPSISTLPPACGPLLHGRAWPAHE